MSSSSWLQKQRKSELAELAENLGLKNTDGLKKTDLELALEDHLKSKPELSTDTRVAPFFSKRRSAESITSPVKKETASVASDAEKAVRSVKRRVTKAAEEISNAVASATEDSEIEPTVTRARTAVARTPSRALALAQSVPLPPSPSVVADAIDRRTAVLRGSISKAYEESGVTETVQATREALSTVVSVEAIIIAFEAYVLRQELLADRYAFTIPAIKLIGTSEYAVKIPDMFLVLTSSFWGPTTLWACTSLLIPLLAAYFFNLTSKPRSSRSHTSHFTYAFDPLTFNIVKALLTYLVYVQDVTFGGLVNLAYVARINSALYGGPQGVLLGCLIGTIVTFYEAIIKK